VKILLISNIFPPGFIGGYELAAFEIAQYLKQRGHSVQVLSSDYFTDNEQLLPELEVDRVLEYRLLGPQVIRDPISFSEAMTINWRNLKKVSSSILRFQPDLVFAFNLSGLGPQGFIHFLNALEIPTVLYLGDSFAGTDLRGYERIFGKLVAGRNIHVIAMSQNILDLSTRYLGVVPENVAYAPGWVDVADIPPGLDERDAKGPIRFVFSSRLETEKGIYLVLDAAQELVQAGHSGFEIDLYGTGSQLDGTMRGIAARKLDGIVRYLGRVEKNEMVRAFRQYDALLFPTYMEEAYGFVVSEAAVNGCIPLMTYEAGANEWFINEVDCLKFDRNVAALKTAMRKILDLPRGDLQRMRARTKANARRYLAMDYWMAEIERICQHAASTPGRAMNVHFVEQVQASFLVLSELWHEEQSNK